MTSEQAEVRQFLTEFSKIAKGLGIRARVDPHYVLWYCSECSRNNFVNEHKDCVSGGRYCAPDPDYDGPRTGREIVMEDLRQICVYKYAIKKEDYNIWWNYIVEFAKCDNNNFNEKCSFEAMKTAKIDVSEITKCVTESFTGPNFALDDNNLLKKEKKGMIERGIFFYPSIIINNVAYRGDLETEEVL